MSYVATLSQSQGRSAWAVIFRHPGLPDRNTDKRGRRVRRGLGTADREAAESVVAEINALLGDDAWWTPSARGRAAERFSPKAISIFYGAMTQEESDPSTIREQLIHLADGGETPRMVALIGTTGAGKTSVLRQLIGTTPEERFPATSKSKTTIHDTEAIVRLGPYRAAVTFVPRDELAEYLAENLIRATIEAADGRDDETILHRILVHADQRMRFNYVLGNGPGTVDDEESGEQAPEDLLGTLPSVELLNESTATLSAVLLVVHQLAGSIHPRARDMAEAESHPDQRQQVYEEEMERLARKDEAFHNAVDALVDEVEKRFEILSTGTLDRDSTGWPQAWYFQAEDRATFLREVRRFSSNHAALFGALLTPLVSGIRTSGPFIPTWQDSTPSLAYFDGEGLGHTPETAAALPSALITRLEHADVILLVDNAEQPMQAAPAAAVRELFAAGLLPRLHIAFTHMDRLAADNLPTDKARRLHVQGSALGVGAALREFAGPASGGLAERAFRQVVDERTAYLGHVDVALDGTSADPQLRRSHQALSTLYQMIAAEAPPQHHGPSVPRYSLLTLGLAVHRAVSGYLESWGGRLGQEASQSPRPAWQTVKAMTRRIALWPGAEGFRDLAPVAEFRRDLMEQLSGWIRTPIGWSGPEPTEDSEKNGYFDKFAQELIGRLNVLARMRVKEEVHLQWISGLEVSGKGSTRERAKIIFSEILGRAAPRVDVAISVDANRLLEQVRLLVQEAAAASRVELADV